MRCWPLVTMLLTTTALAQALTLQIADSGCAGVIERYRAVQANDLLMGHVNKSVYAQIKHEIEEAEKVCTAGQDASATSMIRASQSRHGYPTSI